MSNMDKLVSLIPIEEIEQSAMTQIHDVLELDFLIKLAIMPDVHSGYHLPIGGVALLQDVISSSFVGYDISCSVAAIVTDVDIPKWTMEEKNAIRDMIIANVPLGFTTHEQDQGYEIFKSALGDKNLDKAVNAKLGVQLGTLGGGKGCFGPK